MRGWRFSTSRAGEGKFDEQLVFSTRAGEPLERRNLASREFLLGRPPGNCNLLIRDADDVLARDRCRRPFPVVLLGLAEPLWTSDQRVSFGCPLKSRTSCDSGADNCGTLDGE